MDFITQAGSRLPSNELQGNEAESVTKLKNAGALILGKTVTTEFAYFSPVQRAIRITLNTPRAVQAVVRPRRLRRVCVLSRLALKPLARSFVPPRFVEWSESSQPMIAFRAMVSFRFRHRSIILDFSHPMFPLQNKLLLLYIRIGMTQSAPNKKPTLGIPEGPYLACASDYALACFNAICDSLAEAGYELRRIRIMDDYQEIRARHDVIMSAEAARVHEEWFEKYENLYSLKIYRP